MVGDSPCCISGFSCEGGICLETCHSYLKLSANLYTKVKITNTSSQFLLPSTNSSIPLTSQSFILFSPPHKTAPSIPPIPFRPITLPYSVFPPIFPQEYLLRQKPLPVAQIFRARGETMVKKELRKSKGWIISSILESEEHEAKFQ